MLRKVRREGLSSEQLAALGGSSQIDDSEARIGQRRQARQRRQGQDRRDRAADGRRRLPRLAAPRRPSSTTRRTQPAPMDHAGREHRAAAPLEPGSRRRACRRRRRRSEPAASWRAAAPAAAVMSPGMSPLSPLDARRRRPPTSPTRSPSKSARSPTTPSSTKPVIAFANADFELCEQSLSTHDGARRQPRQHAETWLVLFDLYRAIGQQQQVREPGARLRAAVRLVGAAVVLDAQAGGRGRQRAKTGPSAPRIEGQVGWVCPELRRRRRRRQAALADAADAAAVGVRLGRAAAASIAEACARMSELFRSWIGQKLDMRWLSGERLFTVLQRRRAHRRARCRPGVLAASPRRAAHGQPPRPVRRGGDRLLRHLRGVAAVVGAGAVPGAHQRRRPQHAARRRCRW